MRIAKNVAINAIYNTLALVVGNISGLFIAIILARVLTPKFFGMYWLALSIANMATTLTNLGINGALARYVAYYAGMENLEKIRGHFRYFLKYKLIITLIISVLLIFFSNKLALLFKNNELTIQFILAGLIVLSASFASFLDAFYRGIQEFKYIFFKQITYECSRWLFVVPLAYIFLSTGAVCGVALSYLASILFLAIILLSRYRNFVFGKAVSADEKAGKFMGFMTIARISGAVYAYVDSIMIGYLLTVTDVGYYKAAYTLVFAIVGLISSLSSVLFPTFTQLKIDEIDKTLKRLIRYSSAIVFPLIFVITYLSKEIVDIIYGPDYINASLAIFYLSFALIPGAYNYLTTIFNAKERADISALIRLTSLILNLILNYILIVTMGIAGAALATVASSLFVVIVSIYLLYKLFAIIVDLKSISKAFIGFLIMFALLIVLPNSFTITTKILKLSILFIIYIVYIFLVKLLTWDDIKYIRGIIYLIF